MLVGVVHWLCPLVLACSHLLAWATNERLLLTWLTFSSNLASDDHLDVTNVGRNNLVVVTPKSAGMLHVWTWHMRAGLHYSGEGLWSVKNAWPRHGYMRQMVDVPEKN